MDKGSNAQAKPYFFKKKVFFEKDFSRERIKFSNSISNFIFPRFVDPPIQEFED